MLNRKICWKNIQQYFFSVCIYIYIHAVPVKSLETLLFYTFLKEISNAHQACIYLIKKKNSNIKITVIYNLNYNLK